MIQNVRFNMWDPPPKTDFIIVITAVVCLLGLMVGGSVIEFAFPPTPAPLTLTAPADCVDSTNLDTTLNALPANSTYAVPANSCYTVSTSFWLHNTTNLTINGNGATLEASGPNNNASLLFLTENTGLTITDLDLTGAFNGTNGGSSDEADYGVKMEANTGVTLTSLNVNDVQGDGLILQAPFDVTDGSQLLNTNILVQSSTFNNIGYHGLTVESANGFIFKNNTVENDAGVDAMDFEYDTYSSEINTNGSASWAAEDNIQILNNMWENFNGDWFANLQGQTPGVQEQNVMLSGNTIEGSNPLVQIEGTSPSATSPPYWERNITISNNNNTYGMPVNGDDLGARSTTGGPPTIPNVGSTMSIQSVVDLNITGNAFHAYDGDCDPPESFSYFCNTPYLATIHTYGIVVGTIDDNDFSGALDIFHPSSLYNYYVSECGNMYGLNGKSMDTACAE